MATTTDRETLAPELAGMGEPEEDLRAFEVLEQTRSMATPAGAAVRSIMGQDRYRQNLSTLRDYRTRRQSRGEKPFQYLEAARRIEEGRRWREQLPFFGKLFSGPQNFEGAFPSDRQEEVKGWFAGAMNPDADKRQTSNKILYEAMTGEEAHTELWAIQRTRYAQQALGWDPGQRIGADIAGSLGMPAPGKPAIIDDETFYKLAGEKLAKEQSDIDLSEKIAASARKAALDGKPLADVLAQAKQLAGAGWKSFEPAAKQGYAGILRDYSDAEVRSIRPLYDAVAAIQTGDFDQKSPPEAFAVYGRANQRDREKIMQGVGEIAQVEGVDVEAFFARFYQGLRGGTLAISAGVAAGAVRMEADSIRQILEKGKVPESFTDLNGKRASDVLAYMNDDGASNDTNPDRKKTRPITAEEKQMLTLQMDAIKGAADFLSDAQTSGIKVKRYLKEKHENLWDSLADAPFMLAESLPHMVMAATSPAGLLATAASYGERNFSSMRRNSPDADQGKLQQLAYASGVVEAGIDRLQMQTVGATLPKLKAFTLKWGKPGRIAAGVGEGLKITALELGQENVQDLTPRVIEQLAEALSDDIKGPDWRKVLEQQWQAQGDIFAVSLLFGIIGATGSAISDHMAAPQIKQALSDKQGLLLAGYSEATATNIATRAQDNPLAAAELLKVAQMETPVEERQANSAAAREQLEAVDMATKAKELGLPTLQKLEDGRIQIDYPDRAAEIVAGQEEALDAVRQWDDDSQVSMTQAVRSYVGFLSEYHASSPETAFKGETQQNLGTLEDVARRSAEGAAQARGRIEIAMRQAGQEMGGVDLSDIPILGTSQNRVARGVTTIATRFAKDANPLTVIEESAEGVAKWLMDSGRIPEARVIGWLRDAEQRTGHNLLSDNLMNLTEGARRQEMVEAWSYLAKANATGKVQDSALPGPVKSFFRAFKEAIHQAIRIAADFLRIRGQLDPEFTYWLDVSAGVNEDFEKENLTRQMEAELEAQAYEGMPEIRDTLKGRLPHPETLKKAGLPFSGEMRRIHESLKAEHGGKGVGTRRANEFFLPVGETGDLDHAREKANSQGFSFSTPGEMLDALDLSVSYGKPQYGFSSPAEDDMSFSVGGSQVTLTPLSQMVQASHLTVIGPASFSIDAFHGTPHKVDKFTTAKMGTGEGAQAFGWGLYFAQAEEVAAEYRRILGQQFDVDGEILMRAGNFGTAHAKLRDAIGPDASDIIVAFLPDGKKRVVDELNDPLNGIDQETFDRAMDWLDRIEQKDSGNLYKVRLKPSAAELLDWSQPLHQQPEAIRRVAVTHFEQRGFNLTAAMEMNGREFYGYAASSQQRDDEAADRQASEYLLKLGIRGIRFLDGKSRQTGTYTVRGAGNFYAVIDGNGQTVGEFTNHQAAKEDAENRNAGRSYNYVIFSDDDIEITAENGVPVDLSSAPSFGVGIPKSPLVEAIKARIKNPADKAKIYGRMLAMAQDVRKRFDTKRLKGEFGKGGVERARFEELRDLATLEAIAKALPAEIRGRYVGAFTALDELKTTKGREQYMIRLLGKVERGIEIHLQKLYRQAIRKVMDRSRPQKNDSRNVRGRIGAIGHAVAKEARDAMTKTHDEAMTAAASLRDTIESGEIRDGVPLTLHDYEELEGRAMALELFADYEEADSARLAKALDFLKLNYAASREEWIGILKGRKEEREGQVRMLRKVLGAPDFVTEQMLRDAAARDKKVAKTAVDAMLEWVSSGYQTFERLKERTSDPAALAWVDTQQEKLRKARGAYDDAVEAERKALMAAMQRIFGTSGRWTGEFELDPILHDLSKGLPNAPVSVLEGFKKEQISVPIHYVEALVEGEASGFAGEGGKRVDLNDADLVALTEAWENFQDLPEDAQKGKRVIHFERIVSTGKRGGVGTMSQLEGLKEWLAMRQPDAAAKYEAIGWDAKTFTELDAWLKPEVKELGLWMVDKLDQQAPALNELHRSEFGIGLDLVQNYFPLVYEAGADKESTVSTEAADVGVRAKTASGLKGRVSHRARPRPMNALAVFLSNRAQIHYFMTHAVAMREMVGVFRSREAGEAIKVTLGPNYSRALSKWLTTAETNGVMQADGLLAADSFIRKLQSGYALGVLGLKLKTLMVNTTAVWNTFLGVTVREMAKGFTPEYINDLRAVINSPAMQRRLKHGTSHEMRIAMQGGIGGHPLAAGSRRAAQASMELIRWVDSYSNAATLAAAYRATFEEARAAGVPEAAAKTRAEDEIGRLLTTVAQPDNLLSRSLGEIKISQNPISAFLFLFASETRKNFAIGLHAVRKLATGKGAMSREMALQQLIVLGLFYSATGYMLRSAYEALFKADDDEPEEMLARLGKRLSDPKAWMYAMATEHLKGIPLIGEAANHAAAELLGQKSRDSSPNPLNRLTDTTARLVEKSKDEKSIEDWTQQTIDALQAGMSLTPETAVIAQAGNVGEDMLGLLTANGWAMSDTERRKRIKARFSKFSKKLDEELGKTTGEDGKVRKDVQSAKWKRKAEWLRDALAPLEGDDRAEALQEIDPPEGVADLVE